MRRTLLLSLPRHRDHRLRCEFATVTLPNQRNPIHSLGKQCIARPTKYIEERRKKKIKKAAVTRNKIMKYMMCDCLYDMFARHVRARSRVCKLNAKNEWHCRTNSFSFISYVFVVLPQSFLHSTIALNVH